MIYLILLITTSVLSSIDQTIWMPFWEAKHYFGQSKWNGETPKKTIIFLHDSNNAWSKRMLEEVFIDEEFSEFINENYNAVLWEVGSYYEDVIYDKILYKYLEDKDLHQFVVFLTGGKIKFPYTVVLDGNFKIERKIKGYVPENLLKEKLTVKF